MKIVVLDGYTLNPGDINWEKMKDLGEFDLYDRTDKEDILTRAKDAEIIITNKTPITKETIEKLPNLKYIGVLATGYNIVDVDFAKEKGIPVSNIPTYGTTSVSQFAFALILQLCHHVGEHSEAVHAGDWTNSKDFCFWNYPLIELYEKTIGIIGFGKIGQMTADIAISFGMNVLAYDKFPINSKNEKIKSVDLEELFINSDIVSLHCPLFPDTQGIINTNSLKKMKKTALLINTSRGPLVIEEDLANALNNDVIAGAALDVLSVEPPKADNPLLRAKNCIITPHIAWATKSARERLMETAVQNIIAFQNGNPINVVNK